MFKRRRQIYDDLSEEIQQHLEEQVEALMGEGMSRKDAEHAARRAFGNVTLIEERGREQWHLPRFENIWSDVKFGLRQLVRYRSFTMMAVLTLALGIGANTAIFTLVDSILLRPLPFPQQSRLMAITGGADDPGVYPKGWIRALGEKSESFQSIAGYMLNSESNISENSASERIFGSAVTVNMFDTLGIHPALGRFFDPENAVEGQDRVVVLSYGYWKQHFGGSGNVLGRTIRIDGIPRRIVGVMPGNVHFPTADTQFLVPVSFKGGDTIDPWRTFQYRALGRLKDGVSPATAQAELRRLHPLLLPLYPWTMPDAWEADTTVISLLDSVVGDMRPRLLLLFSAVGLVLLIACANVANMMLARAASREREMAIRGALGASGKRIVRQLLIESILLSLLAGMAGLAIAGIGLQTFLHLLPASTPRMNDISLHWSVFLFTMAASVCTGILFGLAPAIKMASPHLQQTLRSGSTSIAGKTSQFRLSMMLVIGQIALSVVIITSAGLMLHSLYSLSKVDPGFRTNQIVTAEVSLDSTACRETGRCLAFFQELDRRMQGLTGIENAALVNSLPMTGWDLGYVYDAENHVRDPRQPAKQAAGRTISSDYFRLTGVRLLRGRLLNDADQAGTSRAAVINQKMAEKLWPNRDPLGKHIISVAAEQAPAQMDMAVASVVVGVVSNTHHASLAESFDEEVYLPMTQKSEAPQMMVLLRSKLPAEQTASELRAAVAQMDPLVPVTHVRTLNEVVAASSAAPRSLTVLLSGFAALAAAVGAMGVYSLIAYIVSWRTREIGIRIALGAPRMQIMKMVLRQSVVLAAAGSLFGLAASGISAQLLRSFLFAVRPFDPVTFCAVPAFMLAVALVAAWVPARRAASVDPMQTLRGD